MYAKFSSPESNMGLVSSPNHRLTKSQAVKGPSGRPELTFEFPFASNLTVSITEALRADKSIASLIVIRRNSCFSVEQLLNSGP